MNITAIVHKSAGNDTVGEMWHETKVFCGEERLKDIFEGWSNSDVPKEIILTVAFEPQEVEFKDDDCPF